jgi:hypothetical protein
MTTPITPGEAIIRAATRHAASVEATRALASQIEAERQKASEGAAQTGAPESP